MQTVAAILLLVTGLACPIAGMFWLNRRLSQRPAPSPRWVGLGLALNGVLPAALIMAGVALLSARVWEMLAFRLALAFVALAALALAVALTTTRGTS